LGFLAVTFFGSALAFLAFACFFGDLETLAFLIDLGMSAKDVWKVVETKIRAGGPESWEKGRGISGATPPPASRISKCVKKKILAQGKD
jgi:hypothetical protein